MNKKAQYFVIILIISIVGLAFLYWYVEISNRFGYLYSTDNSSYKLEIQGFNLKLYSFNESEISESEFRNLKSRGVNLVIGPIYSVTGFKIYPYLEKYDLLSFSPTISSDRLLSLTNRIFSFTPTNEMQINAIVSFLKEKGISNLLVLLDALNRTYSEEYLKILDQINGDYIYFYNLNSILNKDLDFKKYDAILITTISSAAVDIISIIENRFEGIFILSDSALDIDLVKLKVNKDKVFFVSFTKNPLNAALDLAYEVLDMINSHKFISAQQAYRFYTENKYYFNEKRTLNREIKIVNLSHFQGD